MCCGSFVGLLFGSAEVSGLRPRPRSAHGPGRQAACCVDGEAAEVYVFCFCFCFAVSEAGEPLSHTRKVLWVEA